MIGSSWRTLIENMEKYDLTTQLGVKCALRAIEATTNPSSIIINYLLDFLRGFFDANNPEKQSKAASHLIEVARANGAKEVELTMNNTKGLKFNVKDANVDTLLGADGKIHMHVIFR